VFRVTRPANGQPIVYPNRLTPKGRRAVGQWQEADGPTLVALTQVQRQELERFLTEFRKADDRGEIKLDPGDRAEVDADIDALQAQLSSPKPKRRVVAEILASLRNVLEGAAGGGIVFGLQQLSVHIR
jgi:hypothetical protein